ASETDTGWYRIAADQWQWVAAAQLVVRFRSAGILLAAGKALDFDTTTGGYLGSAPTVKMGFWGATPAVRPAAVADATDAPSVITQLNALLARLRTIGIIA